MIHATTTETCTNVGTAFCETWVKTTEQDNGWPSFTFFYIIAKIALIFIIIWLLKKRRK